MKKLNFTSNSVIWVKVYEYLREPTMKGEIEPNQRLFEAAIVEKVGTSRTSSKESSPQHAKGRAYRTDTKVCYKVRQVSETEVAQV